MEKDKINSDLILKVLKYSGSSSLLALPYLLFKFFNVPLNSTLIIISFGCSCIFYFIIQGKWDSAKKICDAFGDWLDMDFDQTINKYIYVRKLPGTAINYLTCGKIDPYISCEKIGRDHKFKNCRREYCRFGPKSMLLKQTRLLKENNIDITKITGHTNIQMYVLVPQSSGNKIFTPKRAYSILKLTVSSWSFTGITYQCLGLPNNRFKKKEYGFIVVPHRFWPTYQLVLVAFEERYSEIENRKEIVSTFEAALDRDDYKKKRTSLTLEKIQGNPKLKNDICFCKNKY